MLQTEICHWFLLSFLTFFYLAALLAVRISWLFSTFHWRFYWSRSNQDPADLTSHYCCDFAFTSVFDLKFMKNWGRLPRHRLHTEPVPETFEDSSLLACALDSLLATEASSFPWYSAGKRGLASWELAFDWPKIFSMSSFCSVYFQFVSYYMSAPMAWQWLT